MHSKFWRVKNGGGFAKCCNFFKASGSDRPDTAAATQARAVSPPLFANSFSARFFKGKRNIFFAFRRCVSEGQGHPPREDNYVCGGGLKTAKKRVSQKEKKTMACKIGNSHVAIPLDFFSPKHSNKVKQSRQGKYIFFLKKKVCFLTHALSLKLPTLMTGRKFVLFLLMKHHSRLFAAFICFISGWNPSTSEEEKDSR